jgi:arylsulfatase A-like enzyme
MRFYVPRVLATLLAAFMMGACECPNPQPAAPSCRGCNVVLVTFDALAARRLGTFGAERNTSPAIDLFAEESYVFKNAMSQSGTTIYSFASLFTSRLPHTDDLFRVGENPAPYAYLGGLASEEVTLAEMLADRGYATAAVVGWWYAGVALGQNHGFEVFEGRSMEDMETAPQTLERAAEVLGRLESPFFLWVHFRTPHAPYQPEPEVFRELHDAAPGEPTLLSHTFEEVFEHFDKSRVGKIYIRRSPHRRSSPASPLQETRYAIDGRAVRRNV